MTVSVGQATSVSLYSILEIFNTSFTHVFFVERKHEPLRSKVDEVVKSVQLSLQSKNGPTGVNKGE